MNPLNGQIARQQLVELLGSKGEFDAVIETGTFKGATTRHLAETLRLPVYSVESNRRYYTSARLRLRSTSGVHLTCGDSRTFIRSLASAPQRVTERPFIYLDAHWTRDLPLVEELQTIFSAWNYFVVLIDDFQVPFDPGYGFDQYGDQRLDIDLIRPVLPDDCAVYFPSTPALEDTGYRRGSVVLCPPSLTSVLNGIPLLRRDR